MKTSTQQGEASAPRQSMPRGGMHSSTSDGMPRGDMIALPEVAGMPSGAMLRPPGRGMPNEASQPAGYDEPSSGMPSGAMIDAASDGMPRGAMHRVSGTDAWNMDLATAKPPCGCI